MYVIGTQESGMTDKDWINTLKATLKATLMIDVDLVSGLCHTGELTWKRVVDANAPGAMGVLYIVWRCQVKQKFKMKISKSVYYGPILVPTHPLLLLPANQRFPLPLPPLCCQLQSSWCSWRETTPVVSPYGAEVAWMFSPLLFQPFFCCNPSTNDITVLSLYVKCTSLHMYSPPKILPSHNCLLHPY